MLSRTHNLKKKEKEHRTLVSAPVLHIEVTIIKGVMDQKKKNGLGCSTSAYQNELPKRMARK
jgi:hypothetical protein